MAHLRGHRTVACKSGAAAEGVRGLGGEGFRGLGVMGYRSGVWVCGFRGWGSGVRV